jgi:hypothetical protein
VPSGIPKLPDDIEHLAEAAIAEATDWSQVFALSLIVILERAQSDCLGERIELGI